LIGYQYGPQFPTTMARRFEPHSAPKPRQRKTQIELLVFVPDVLPGYSDRIQVATETRSESLGPGDLDGLPLIQW
jgi:hypothetical protein